MSNFIHSFISYSFSPSTQSGGFKLPDMSFKFFGRTMTLAVVTAAVAAVTTIALSVLGVSAKAVAIAKSVAIVSAVVAGSAVGAFALTVVFFGIYVLLTENFHGGALEEEEEEIDAPARVLSQAAIANPHIKEIHPSYEMNSEEDEWM